MVNNEDKSLKEVSNELEENASDYSIGLITNFYSTISNRKVTNIDELPNVDLIEGEKILQEKDTERENKTNGIIGSRSVPNARKTIRWTKLRIKHKVPFFHIKYPIFDKKTAETYLYT